MSLDIIDLHVEVEGQEIIKGINLTFDSGKVHALMGPNGAGKSTLAHALMGHPKNRITQGKILLDGEDITNDKPATRARKGLFLSFQYPAEIPGVTIRNFLRTAVNNLRADDKQYSVLEFHQLLKEKMAELKIDPAFAGRYLNEGLSGGEKKRIEMLQLLMLNPKYALLDETDSGLDVDALKTVTEVINGLHGKTGIVVITHYNSFLEHLKLDRISILYYGKIVKKGGCELAKEIEEKGFHEFTKAENYEKNYENNYKDNHNVKSKKNAEIIS